MTDLEKRVEDLEEIVGFSLEIVRKLLWTDKGGYYNDDFEDDLRKLVKLKEEMDRKGRK